MREALSSRSAQERSGADAKKPSTIRAWPKRALIRIVGLLGLLLAAGAGGFWGAEGSAAALNYTVGFLGALAIVGASFFGYWQMVSGAEATPPLCGSDDGDPMRRIEDRFELWEDEAEVSPPSASESPQEVLARERARLKVQRLPWRERIRHARPALSLYRLGAYGVMAFSLVWLIDSGRFEPLAYFLGAGVPPLAVAWSLLRGLGREITP